jgi:hypothetical protein
MFFFRRLERITTISPWSTPGKVGAISNEVSTTGLVICDSVIENKSIFSDEFMCKR